MKLRNALMLLLMTISLIGCQPAKDYLGDPELPYPPEREPVIGDILHLPTGIYVDQQVMLNHARQARVIFVGETHDNPASHRLEVDVLNALQQHNRGNITLAMEMFTPSQQPVLDLWSAGKLSEKEFLQQVDWFHTWRMNFSFYRPLLTFCRDHNIPILALNAEKELKQKVSRTPLDQLSEEERQQLPDMVDDPYQQAMVKSVFSGHKMGQAMRDGFQRVQTLWDETMAQNLAAYLKTVDEHHQVLVVAGGNHIRFGFGIPRRMFRRTPVTYLLIGSEELDVPADKQDRLMDIKTPDYPLLPYHFMTFTAYEDLENPGVKLGVLLDQIDNGLQVKDVVAGSIAEQNGLQTDDVLTRIDAQPITQLFDLIYELQQKKPGDTIDLTLKRGEKTLNKSIIVPVKSAK
jgi:uncharacterized iron-regulated protein